MCCSLILSVCVPQEAEIETRIAELKKEGLWSLKKLSKVPEPQRPKVHWDYLCEEMQWLSADFAQERRWKRGVARKVVRMVIRHHEEQRQKEERAKREEQAKLRRIASSIAKEVKQFWTNVEKVVQFKQQSRLDEKRKKALDLQLDFIVGQTEKYSDLLSQSLNEAPPTSKPGSSHIGSSYTGSVSSSPRRPESLNQDEDEDFEPHEEEDDEETIEVEEQQEGNDSETHKQEIELLKRESQVPLEELLQSLPPQILENSGSPQTSDMEEEEEEEEDDEDEDDDEDEEEESDKETEEMTKTHKEKASNPETQGRAASQEEEEDDEFTANVEEAQDEEETIEAQEVLEGDVDHAAELDDLVKEGELSMEQLLQKYAGAYAEDFQFPESPKDSEKSEGEEEGEEEDDDDTTSEDDDDESSSDSLSEQLSEEEEKVEDVGMEYLLKHREVEDEKSNDSAQTEDRGPKKEITDIAAAAESLQPKGYTLATTQVKTPIPFLLRGTLREYQHIGLDWLVTMYEKKLNGILADEMGLGKTIQTISLLAHLACEKGNWGPHLIIVPTSVMLNWEMEFKRWCPGFKILTYYGSQKERKLKRQGWTKPNAFHVCITSYKLVLQDHQAFRRKNWRYLILDEAQNIKNFKSQRWQSLLNFNSQRRLLLTGTPLQNSLMELWSLMHFLMPHVFQSHREFKEWFSNPLTGMIEGSQEYNESLIKRLHKVLRPFLLRRVKVDVEKQMPKKYEHVIRCRLSKRQRYLYDDFMAQASTKETLASGHFMSVINILMQLRKVCNHPNLFDPRPIHSPFITQGICFTTASLVLTALHADPFKHADLSIFDLVNIENKVSRYEAEMFLPKRKVSRKLIEEIADSPDPPPRPRPVKMKVNRMLQPVPKPDGRTVVLVNSPRAPVPTQRPLVGGLSEVPAMIPPAAPLTQQPAAAVPAPTATAQALGTVNPVVSYSSPVVPLAVPAPHPPVVVQQNAAPQHPALNQAAAASLLTAPTSIPQAVPTQTGVPQVIQTVPRLPVQTLASPVTATAMRPSTALPTPTVRFSTTTLTHSNVSGVMKPLSVQSNQQLPGYTFTTPAGGVHQRLILSPDIQAKLPSGEVVSIAQLASLANRPVQTSQGSKPVTFQIQGNKLTLTGTQIRHVSMGQPRPVQGNVVHLVSAGGQHHIISQPTQVALIQTVSQQSCHPQVGVQTSSLQAVTGQQMGVSPGGITIPQSATQVPSAVVNNSGGVVKIVVRQTPKDCVASTAAQLQRPCHLPTTTIQGVTTLAQRMPVPGTPAMSNALSAAPFRPLNQPSASVGLQAHTASSVRTLVHPPVPGPAQSTGLPPVSAPVQSAGPPSVTAPVPAAVPGAAQSAAPLPVLVPAPSAAPPPPVPVQSAALPPLPVPAPSAVPPSVPGHAQSTAPPLLPVPVPAPSTAPLLVSAHPPAAVRPPPVAIRPPVRLLQTSPAVVEMQVQPAASRLIDTISVSSAAREDTEVLTLRSVTPTMMTTPPPPVSTSTALLRLRRQPPPPPKSPFYLDSLEKRKRKQKEERLDRLFWLNERHCAATPVYGTELIRICSVFDSAAPFRETAPEDERWRGLGFTLCYRAQVHRDAQRTEQYWQQTETLCRAIRNPEERLEELADLIERFIFVMPPVEAPPITMHSSHPPPSYLRHLAFFRECMHREVSQSAAPLHRVICNMRTQFPDLRLIQYDCGKLQTLHILLRQLKVGSHRVLVFTQMTRMLDVLEQFLNYHGHIYLRLDGTTRVEQRQALMERFNADRRIFCFILSTRSGGVGVNLTGADTVVFYDSDWNPTMDAQAQDRCHRIGQTRDVHIYRLISERTVEENILKKANQKRMLGDMAIEGGNFTTAYFKQQTIRELFDFSVEEPVKKGEDVQPPPPQQRADEEDSVSSKQTQILEQALCKAEDEEDIRAASQAKAEQVAELAEFNENIPLDAEEGAGREEEEEMSKAEQEIAALVEQLTPIERYAMNFLEASLEEISKEELKQAEEQVEAARKDLDLAKDEVFRLPGEDEDGAKASEEVIKKSKKGKGPPKTFSERQGTRMSERLRGTRPPIREMESDVTVKGEPDITKPIIAAAAAAQINEVMAPAHAALHLLEMDTKWTSISAKGLPNEVVQKEEASSQYVTLSEQSKGDHEVPVLPAPSVSQTSEIDADVSTSLCPDKDLLGKLPAQELNKDFLVKVAEKQALKPVPAKGQQMHCTDIKQVDITQKAAQPPFNNVLKESANISLAGKEKPAADENMQQDTHSAGLVQSADDKVPERTTLVTEQVEVQLQATQAKEKRSASEKLNEAGGPITEPAASTDKEAWQSKELGGELIPPSYSFKSDLNETEVQCVKPPEIEDHARQSHQKESAPPFILTDGEELKIDSPMKKKTLVASHSNQQEKLPATVDTKCDVLDQLSGAISEDGVVEDSLDKPVGMVLEQQVLVTSVDGPVKDEWSFSPTELTTEQSKKAKVVQEQLKLTEVTGTVAQSRTPDLHVLQSCSKEKIGGSEVLSLPVVTQEGGTPRLLGSAESQHVAECAAKNPLVAKTSLKEDLDFPSLEGGWKESQRVAEFNELQVTEASEICIKESPKEAFAIDGIDEVLGFSSPGREPEEGFHQESKTSIVSVVLPHGSKMKKGEVEADKQPQEVEEMASDVHKGNMESVLVRVTESSEDKDLPCRPAITKEATERSFVLSVCENETGESKPPPAGFDREASVHKEMTSSPQGERLEVAKTEDVSAQSSEFEAGEPMRKEMESVQEERSDKQTSGGKAEESSPLTKVPRRRSTADSEILRSQKNGDSPTAKVLRKLPGRIITIVEEREPTKRRRKLLKTQGEGEKSTAEVTAPEHRFSNCVSEPESSGRDTPGLRNLPVRRRVEAEMRMVTRQSPQRETSSVGGQKRPESDGEKRKSGQESKRRKVEQESRMPTRQRPNSEGQPSAGSPEPANRMPTRQRPEKENEVPVRDPEAEKRLQPRQRIAMKVEISSQSSESESETAAKEKPKAECPQFVEKRKRGRPPKSPKLCQGAINLIKSSKSSSKGKDDHIDRKGMKSPSDGNYSTDSETESSSTQKRETRRSKTLKNDVETETIKKGRQNLLIVKKKNPEEPETDPSSLRVQTEAKGPLGEPPVQKRKRGRPPKVCKIETPPETHNVVEPAQSKRSGIQTETPVSSPKSVSEESKSQAKQSVDSGTSAPVQENPEKISQFQKRKRGRPPKKDLSKVERKTNPTPCSDIESTSDDENNAKPRTKKHLKKKRENRPEASPRVTRQRSSLVLERSNSQSLESDSATTSDEDAQRLTRSMRLKLEAQGLKNMSKRAESGSEASIWVTRQSIASSTPRTESDNDSVTRNRSRSYNEDSDKSTRKTTVSAKPEGNRRVPFLRRADDTSSVDSSASELRSRRHWATKETPSRSTRQRPGSLVPPLENEKQLVKTQREQGRVHRRPKPQVLTSDKDDSMSNSSTEEEEEEEESSSSRPYKRLRDGFVRESCKKHKTEFAEKLFKKKASNPSTPEGTPDRVLRSVAAAAAAAATTPASNTRSSASTSSPSLLRRVGAVPAPGSGSRGRKPKT
nr:PREDICTED: helicase SRCAP [Latimeria chalumnae]|eukprot:XP_006000939.1 PREDICTED: helicase SRCAP [Latimeria chalumnae]